MGSLKFLLVKGFFGDGSLKIEWMCLKLARERKDLPYMAWWLLSQDIGFSITCIRLGALNLTWYLTMTGVVTTEKYVQSISLARMILRVFFRFGLRYLPFPVLELLNCSYGEDDIKAYLE